jgi:hypothetical protein
MTVIQALRNIAARKRLMKVEPTHATITELMNEGCTHPEIRAAVKTGKIKYGRTLNSFYFYESNN